MKPARGCVNGLLIAVILWAIILVTVWQALAHAAPVGGFVTSSRTPNHARRMTRAYIADSTDRHVWDCRPGGCRVSFNTRGSITDNGAPIWATYIGHVDVSGAYCTFDPRFFHWTRCR